MLCDVLRGEGRGRCRTFRKRTRDTLLSVHTRRKAISDRNRLTGYRPRSILLPVPRNRKVISVSFPTEKDAEEAKRKAKQGNRGGMSKVIQRFFRNLADLSE